MKQQLYNSLTDILFFVMLDVWFIYVRKYILSDAAVCAISF
jgi:hypothetical protein